MILDGLTGAFTEMFVSTLFNNETGKSLQLLSVGKLSISLKHSFYCESCIL